MFPKPKQVNVTFREILLHPSSSCLKIHFVVNKNRLSDIENKLNCYQRGQ